MPIFEYKCTNCGSFFEALVNSSTERDVVCPECGGKELSKQFSTFAASTRSPGKPDQPSCPSGTCGTGMCPYQ
jgi:putative FmdB family regulatory protein